MNKNISEDFAQNYDKYVVENGWFSPEILLGLCHPYITAGQKLLDIGIGTGLSSIHFKKAGLEITGIDNSDYMLAICRSKQICKELVLHDISDLPLPFEDKSFDIVIANGIFHLTGSLSYIVTEINRLLKENGIFAFTVDILQNKDKMIMEYSSER